MIEDGATENTLTVKSTLLVNSLIAGGLTLSLVTSVLIWAA